MLSIRKARRRRTDKEPKHVSIQKQIVRNSESLTLRLVGGGGMRDPF